MSGKSLQDVPMICWIKASWLGWSLSAWCAYSRLDNLFETLHPFSRCWSYSERWGVIWFLQETGDYPTQMEEIYGMDSLDLSCGCNLNCCWAWCNCLSWNRTILFISLLIKSGSKCGTGLLYKAKPVLFQSYGQKRTGFCLNSRLPSVLSYSWDTLHFLK